MTAAASYFHRGRPRAQDNQGALVRPFALQGEIASPCANSNLSRAPAPPPLGRRRRRRWFVVEALGHMMSAF